MPSRRKSESLQLLEGSQAKHRKLTLTAAFTVVYSGGFDKPGSNAASVLLCEQAICLGPTKPIDNFAGNHFQLCAIGHTVWEKEEVVA